MVESGESAFAMDQTEPPSQKSSPGSAEKKLSPSQPRSSRAGRPASDLLNGDTATDASGAQCPSPLPPVQVAHEILHSTPFCFELSSFHAYSLWLWCQIHPLHVKNTNSNDQFVFWFISIFSLYFVLPFHFPIFLNNHCMASQLLFFDIFGCLFFLCF